MSLVASPTHADEVPAVPAGTSRLRANVTVGHSLEEIERAMNIFEAGAKQIGVLPS